jgi:hypothetical protein
MSVFRARLCRWRSLPPAFLLDATANANPLIYQGKNGREYVAIVAGRTVHAFALL